MRILLALLLVCAVSACNRPAADAVAPATGDQAPAAAAEPAAKPAVDTANCAFCAEPSFVRTCEIASGVRTTLYWNIADPNVTLVGIYVVDDAGNDSSFAEQPPQGSIETGPWLKPGLTFKLKDQDANLLESVVIEGKEC